MNNMDNCGCGPGEDFNQSDNLMGGGFSLSHSSTMANALRTKPHE